LPRIGGENGDPISAFQSEAFERAAEAAAARRHLAVIQADFSANDGWVISVIAGGVMDGVGECVHLPVRVYCNGFRPASVTRRTGVRLKLGGIDAGSALASCTPNVSHAELIGNIQIGFGRFASLAHQIAFVGLETVQGETVLLRMDRNVAVAKFRCCA
jgi:hypothetical protein